MTNNYPPGLTKFSNLLPMDAEIANLTVYTESKEYSACTFRLNNKTVEFRLAKITPKKIGQFVTLWKRDGFGITQPFHELDKLDYIIIACEREERFGVFIFPKPVLLEKKIVSTPEIQGKRGIRVYPSWNTADNPQSKRTQAWQGKYFIELNEGKPKNQILIVKMLEV